MKVWRIVLGAVGLVVGLIGVLSVVRLGILLWLGSSMGSEEELRRLSSPDGRRIAVVSRTNGGATTSYGYFVHVDGMEAFMAYGPTIRGAYGMDVRWRDDRTLTVTFDHARWTRRGGTGEVEVVVKGAIDEP